jgi:hypothetical protein
MSDDIIEVAITEDELEVEITDGGEFYMLIIITVTMISSPQSFLFATFGLPTISNARIPARPETGVEREVFVTACDNTGFTLELSDIGEGELPLTFPVLIIGG